MPIERTEESRIQSAAAILQKNKPDIQSSTSKTEKERKGQDPSAAIRSGQSYPIPAFFEYRAKPKEHDSL